MKLPRHAFQTYWDVHAWSGALAAIVLCAMFFAGAFALFHEELAEWQDVRAHHAGGAPCPPGALEPLASAAADAAPFAARTIFLTLPHAESGEAGCGPVSIEMRGASPVERHVVLGDARTGEVLPRRSNVSTFLFYLHFLYHPDLLGGAGMYLAGLLGVVLLLAIVSGVLIHLKDLARQLHRYREERGTRVIFSDLHKVLGVMGLPFQTMVALTGAIICFAAPLARVWQGPVFGGDPQGGLRAFFDIERAPPAVGEEGARISIDEILARASAALPEMEPESLRIDHHGDAASSVEVRGPVRDVLFGMARVRVLAADGEIASVSVLDSARATHVLMRWVYGLHYAWALGVPTKLVYGLLALAGCATLLTGNWIWLARRDRERKRRGNRVLARLTLGGGLGIAVAVAAMFLANRVVPFSLAWHLDAELGAFVLAWSAAMVASFTMRDEARCAIALLATAGAGFVLTALASVAVSPLNALTAPMSIPGAVDLGSIALGGILVGCALLVQRLAARRAQ